MLFYIMNYKKILKDNGIQASEIFVLITEACFEDDIEIIKFCPDLGEGSAFEIMYFAMLGWLHKPNNRKIINYLIDKETNCKKNCFHCQHNNGNHRYVKSAIYKASCNNNSEAFRELLELDTNIKKEWRQWLYGASLSNNDKIIKYIL